VARQSPALAQSTCCFAASAMCALHGNCFLPRSLTLAAPPPHNPHTQVEHYACLEELRTLHGEFKRGGGAAVATADGGAAAAAAHASEEAPPAAESFRDLLHALQLVQPRRGPQPVEAPQVNGLSRRVQLGGSCLEGSSRSLQLAHRAAWMSGGISTSTPHSTHAQTSNTQ